MRVIFMGTPEFAVPSLERLILDQYQVVSVYTQPDRAAGRGRSLVSSPVKRAALERNLPVLQPVNFKDKAAVSQLAELQPDVLVVAAFGQILPQAVLDVPAHGCINIHPSLLPEFRGASPVAAAILAGKEFTGVSIMLLDRGMDTGPVLTRAQIPISASDTTGSLAGKLSRVAAGLLLEVLPRWVKGEITPQPQDEAAATYTRVLTKGEGEIDWQLPAGVIWRRVRAFHPWPGCYTRWLGKQFRIIEAVPLAGEGAGKAGEVIALNDEGGAVLGIGTGEGILGVLRVQMEGKRVMSAAEFLRGQRQFIGAILPSD
ncbi:MAG: methionyl-tRNA formyltransferase [Dehalococcoidales bacterium]|nr:methionyl-tRNA formyltransferase [Dehalococcoidales bacterium]